MAEIIDQIAKIVEFLANIKVISEFFPRFLLIPIMYDKKRRKFVVGRVTVTREEASTDGSGKRREETQFFETKNLPEISVEPSLPLGSGQCLIVNNPDLWSKTKDRQYRIGDWVCLVAARADEEITIRSLERRSDPRSFRVVVSKPKSIQAAIWENGQYRDYTSQEQASLGNSKWHFTRLESDRALQFDEEAVPGSLRTVILFDPNIVAEAWHITRHLNRLPDEHYIVVRAL